MTSQILNGDCLDILRTLPDSSVDSIVTDPPYGLGREPDAMAMLADWLATGHHDVKGTGFMGKAWDAFVPQPALWRECLRVLKPGGHLLAFAGTRTHDLMTLGLRIAGFEIRDTIMWVYGSGFPKSLDVSKAIDKAVGAVGGQGAVKGRSGSVRNAMAGDFTGGEYHEYIPATDAARQWQGWGTALKPAHEPIVVARKPLGEKTVAANVLAHGTGALNIDGCRVGDDVTVRNGNSGAHGRYGKDTRVFRRENPPGRWPANLIHDGSDEVLAAFPQAPGQQRAVGPQHGAKPSINTYGDFGPREQFNPRGDKGSAARFFYCAKASKSDRGADNNHPTVKPTELMRYLCRLVTPAGGLVLDPFMGSGSTGKAAMLEGFAFIGIERESEYCKIAESRIARAYGT